MYGYPDDEHFLDEERVENLPEDEREYYEWVVNHGSEEEIARAKEYFD